MSAGLIVLSGLISLTVSFLANTQALFLVSAALLAFYAFLVVLDSRVTLQDLSQILRQFGKSKKEGNSLASQEAVVLTSVGRHAGSLLEALHYRLQTLLWETQARDLGRVPLGKALVQKMRGELAIEGNQEETEPQFLERALVEISRRFRCRACGLVVESPNAERRVVVVNGVQGARFERALDHQFFPFFTSGLGDVFGLKDLFLETRAMDLLAVFGFRFGVSAPLAIGRGAEVRRGVLWLGYSAAHPPSDVETSLVRDIADELAGELTTFREFRAVSSRAIEAEQQSHENAQAIAHISHDIRSPLNNLRAMLTLFGEDSTSPEQQELINSGLRNCESLTAMISDLLDFSCHQMGGLRARIEPFSCSELAHEVVQSFAATAALKNLTLRFEGQALGERVRADCGHLRRILSNLVSNAIKYTAQGSVVVHVALGADRLVRITVRDTGLGMSAQQTAQLFTPFTRFHVGVAEGIGLGLTLSRILVELSGGTLTVQSQQGVGTTFEILLPAALAEVPVSEPDSRDLQRPTPYAGKVLLVDDDPECLDALARALTRLGFEPKCAYGVKEAIESIASGEFSAIVSDASMPGGGVRKLLEYLNQKGSPIPLMVLSGHQGKEVEFLSAGALKVLLKPASLMEIAEWVRQAATITGAGPTRALVA